MSIFVETKKEITMSKTINDVREAKEELELKIINLIEDFECKNGVYIDCISHDVSRSNIESEGGNVIKWDSERMVDLTAVIR